MSQIPTTQPSQTGQPPIVTRDEWLRARQELLVKEKDLTRMSDELARQRQELPWVPVEKQYTLQTAGGPTTLAELFDGRSQLVVYHFMFGPDYEAGCPSCSSTADSFNGVLAHLKARDVTMICVSRARSYSPIGSAWAGALTGRPATKATSTSTTAFPLARESRTRRPRRCSRPTSSAC